MSAKAKLSIEWLSGCSGCEIAFADLHEKLLKVLQEIDLVRIPILMDTKEYVEADIGMITGSIRTRHDIEAAHRMRDSCTTIIALGTCPVYGGPHGGSYAHTTAELLQGPTSPIPPPAPTRCRTRSRSCWRKRAPWTARSMWMSTSPAVLPIQRSSWRACRPCSWTGSPRSGSIMSATTVIAGWTNPT